MFSTWSYILLVVTFLTFHSLSAVTCQQCCLPPQYSQHVRFQSTTSSNALKSNFTTLYVQHSYVDTLQNRIRQVYVQFYFNEYPQSSYSVMNFLSSDRSVKYIYKWNATCCSCEKEQNVGNAPFQPVCAKGSTFQTTNLGKYPLVIFFEQQQHDSPQHYFLNQRFVTSKVSGPSNQCWIMEYDEVLNHSNRKEHIHMIFSEQRVGVSDENVFVLDSKCPSKETCPWKR
ncbi:hypothetical protein FDP41_003296 [Naegleria fowleri]|uniref:Transmembrane protein n=1 Tax=Naegleria fowleri TaxID=5763 RepID=A0A6A5BUM8_NAEFO|nr:uncharacterized protein FDP41_003296 [Naegleria fowleri]KAF0977974.1 hypothetical protein FDP41_003296 [Naegleria fowleri]CAG4714709.1 unnamed protein product [Naegleria fowleri]